jgi:hypothetical protein
VHRAPSTKPMSQPVHLRCLHPICGSTVLKTSHRLHNAGGGEKDKTKNDDGGIPPLCSTRSESSRPNRHPPPFRLQYHVFLPTSEDPWFVHGPAGQVMVVSLVVLYTSGLVNSRKAISRPYSGGKTVRFEAELSVIKKTFVGHGWNKRQEMSSHVMARSRKRAEQMHVSSLSYGTSQM